MADNKDKTASGSVPRPAHPQATWPVTPAPMPAEFNQWPQQMYWGQWPAAMAYHPAYQMYMQQAPAVQPSAGPSPKSKADSVKVVKPKDSFARSIHSPAGIQSPKPNSPGFLLGASKGAGGRAFSVYTSRADTPGGSVIPASGGSSVDAANAGVDLTKASSKKTSSKSKPPTPIAVDKRDERPVGVAVARQRSAADAKASSDAVEVVSVSSSTTAATSSVATSSTSSSQVAPTTVNSQWASFTSITPFMANPYQHFALAPQPHMYMVPAHRPLFPAQPGLPAPPGYLPVAPQHMMMPELTVKTSQAQEKAHASTSPNKPLSASTSPKQAAGLSAPVALMSPLDKAREKLSEIQRKGGCSRQPSPSNSEARSISSESTEKTTTTVDTHGETKPYHKSVIITNNNCQPLSSPEQISINPPPTKKERKDRQNVSKAKDMTAKSEASPATEAPAQLTGVSAKCSTADKGPRFKARRSAAMSPSDADAAIAALETLPAEPAPLIAPAKFKPTLSQQAPTDASTASTKFIQPASDVNRLANQEKPKARRSRSKDSVESTSVRTQPARRSSANSGQGSPVTTKPLQETPYASPTRLRTLKSPTSTRPSQAAKEVKAVSSRSTATKSRQTGSRAQKRKSTDSVKTEQASQPLPIPVDVADKVYIWAENAFDPIIVKHNHQAYDICEDEDLLQLESKLKSRLKAVNKQIQTHENYLKGDSSSAFPLLLQSLSATESPDSQISPDKLKSNFSVRSDSHPSLKMKAAAKAKSRASQDERKEKEAPPPPDVKPPPISPPTAPAPKRGKQAKALMAPLTPIAIPDQQLRCRRLNKEELSSVDDLILTCIEGLFYESRIKAISPPDLYGVSIDGERHSSKPRIFTQEELVAATFTNRTPTELSQIDIGSRVCAYWSDMISCLYPGRVTDIYPAKNSNAKHLIDIEFDDGDSGKFPLYQMRILPQDLPHIEYDTSNVIPVGRRRRSALPDTPPIMTTPPNRSRLARNSITHSPSHPQASPVPKKKSKSSSAGAVKTPVEPELFDQSTDDEQIDASEPHIPGGGWKWVGPSTKKPTRGRGVRYEYKSATKEEETISVGNFVEVCPNKKSETPYIGEIQNMWGKPSGEMNVTVKWFYHPEDLEVKDVGLPKHKGALFRTEHSDTILVDSVKRKCDVLSHEVYVKKKLHLRTAAEKKKNDIYFFIAGIYNPASKQLTAKYYH